MSENTSGASADSFPESEVDAAEDNGGDTLDEALDPDDASAPEGPRDAHDVG